MKRRIELLVVINVDDENTGFLGVNEYLGQGYIKSYLEQQGHTVNLKFLYPDQDVKGFFDVAPDLIGFSIYSDNTCITLQKAEEIKKSYPSSSIVLGGPQVNTFEKAILKDNSFIDYVISYEGELTFKEFLENLDEDNPLHCIRGLSFREEDGTIITNTARNPVVDLDMFPYPSRAIHEQVSQKYLYIVGSRGCLGGCSFCGETSAKTHIPPPHVRLRSAESIVCEMDFLIKKYQINAFRMTDATFEDPREEGFKRANQIFDLIIERNINVSLHLFTRAELVVKEPNDYFEKAKKAGVECFYIGIESGNDEDLATYHKRSNVNVNKQAIEKIQNSDIHAGIGFINFNPYSTFEGLMKNIEFIYHGHLGHVFYLLQTRLELLPQSSLTKRMQQDGLIENFDYRSHFYDYRFIDKQISMFYTAIKKAYTAPPIYYMDTLLGMDRVFVNRMENQNKVQKFMEKYKALDALCNRYKERNYEFIKSCIDMAANNATVEQMLIFAEKCKLNDIYVEYENIYNQLHPSIFRERFKQLLIG